MFRPQISLLVSSKALSEGERMKKIAFNTAYDTFKVDSRKRTKFTPPAKASFDPRISPSSNSDENFRV